MFFRRVRALLIACALLLVWLMPLCAAESSPEEDAAVIAYTIEQFQPLQSGDEGEGIRLLQLRLRQLGYLSGLETGIYDENTEAALSACLTANEMAYEALGTPEQQLFVLDAGVKSADGITFDAFDPEKPEMRYVGNRNSMRFHFIDCSSVRDMKDENKVPLFSWDEAVEAGYTPCQRCDP